MVRFPENKGGGGRSRYVYESARGFGIFNDEPVYRSRFYKKAPVGRTSRSFQPYRRPPSKRHRRRPTFITVTNVHRWQYDTRIKRADIARQHG